MVCHMLARMQLPCSPSADNRVGCLQKAVGMHVYGDRTPYPVGMSFQQVMETSLHGAVPHDGLCHTMGCATRWHRHTHACPLTRHTVHVASAPPSLGAK
jgi:hypothetical protein